jgi:hypothetical protein
LIGPPRGIGVRSKQRCGWNANERPFLHRS